jgi:hypothetical protein
MFRFPQPKREGWEVKEDTMRKILSVLLVSLGLAAAALLDAAPPAPGARQASASRASAGTEKNRFVGTWKLVNIERHDGKGQLLPPPAPPAFGSANPIGFIIDDPAGYMGVTIMQSGRQKYAANQ